MRLLIVRHGDPDYIHDSLTEDGWKEAELLSERLVNEKIDFFYISPLGRAKDTASFTLQKLGANYEIKEWLQEFTPRIKRPDRKLLRSRAWDWVPSDWVCHPEFLDLNHWYENPVYQEAHVKENYDFVCKEFDALLAEHGYIRNGYMYHTEKGNHETLCFVCHFGLEGVLLSHLMNISPVPLWHGMVAQPSSVTEIYTEERRKGEVYFRISEFGSTEHLYVHDRKPSFAARYAECFEDQEAH